MGIMQVKLIYNRLQFNLTVLLYIVMLWCKKTGLLNVTQSSYKLQVRSPVGSHLSKLVATSDVAWAISDSVYTVIMFWFNAPSAAATID